MTFKYKRGFCTGSHKDTFIVRIQQNLPEVGQVRRQQHA